MTDMTLWPLVLLFGGLPLAVAASPATAASSAWFYVGAYGGSRGIYGISIDLTTGKMSAPKLMADAAGPSFLDYDAAHGRMFCVADAPAGAVSGLKVDSATHALTPINTVAAGGAGTTYVTVTDDGRAVLAANYSAANVSLIRVAADGKLTPPPFIEKHTGHGPDASRQKEPHPHAIQIDPTGKYALSCDLGTDQIYVYALDSAAGTLKLKSQFAMPPGSGPRHLTFSYGGHFCYVVSELTSAVSVLKWDAASAHLSMLQTLPLLPDGFKAAHRGCEVVLHPSGQFLYAVDRGPDLITCFKVDTKTGRLTPVGRTPTGGLEARHFAIAPGGGYLILANQNSDKVVAFRIDTHTGGLTKTDEAAVTRPACVCFVP